MWSDSEDFLGLSFEPKAHKIDSERGKNYYVPKHSRPNLVARKEKN